MLQIWALGDLLEFGLTNSFILCFEPSSMWVLQTSMWFPEWKVKRSICSGRRGDGCPDGPCHERPGVTEVKDCLCLVFVLCCIRLVLYGSRN